MAHHGSSRLLGFKTFMLHYDGFWNKKGSLGMENYIGKSTLLGDVDGDKVSFMDLEKVIHEVCEIPESTKIKMTVLIGDSSNVIDGDIDLMNLWDVILPERDNMYHLFITTPNVPVELTNQGVNEFNKGSEVDNVNEGNEVDFEMNQLFDDVDDTFDMLTSALPRDVTNVGYVSCDSESESGESGDFSDSESDEECPDNHDMFKHFESQSDNLPDFVEHINPRREVVEEIFVGMEWSTIEEARKFMRKYAIVKKFEWKKIYNDNRRLCLDCIDPKCKWNVRIGQIGDGHTMRLKTLVLDHTCLGNVKGKNYLASAKWVAEELHAEMRNHPDYTPKDIKAELWERFGCRITYFTAWNAKNICMELIHGNYNEGYIKCPEMCRQILLKNPGSIAQCHRDPIDQSFIDCCVAFKASLDGFVRGCRPIVGLDGCFLKGRYRGCCLSILSLDANNGLFPIAFFICRGETKEAWTDFLTTLKPYLCQHPLPLTFISDRQKGLLPSVTDIFPHSYHRFCFRHMYKNFKRTYKGEYMRDLAWGASNAYEETEYDKWMALLTKHKEVAKTWLLKEKKESWARAHFDLTSKCEYNCNNYSESFNKWILELRDKPVVQLIDGLQSILMSLMYERRMKARDMNMEDVVPRVHQIIEKYKKDYHKYVVSPSSEFLHSVTQFSRKWTVDLTDKTCTCRAWQLKGIPCIHAACVLIPMRANWTRWCSDYLKIESYMKSYEGVISPIPDSIHWQKPPYEVKPPNIARGPGRPKRNRHKSFDEEETSGKRKCRNCGNYGHNKRSCKGEAPIARGGRRGGAAARGGRRSGAAARGGRRGGAVVRGGAVTRSVAATSMGASSSTTTVASSSAGVRGIGASIRGRGGRGGRGASTRFNATQ